MTFAGAIKSGLVNALKFRGIAKRAEFWYFALFVFLVQIVLGVADSALAMIIKTNTSWLSNIASLLLVVPQLALSARRFHDAGLSAKWLFTQLLPVAAFIYALPAIGELSKLGDNPSDAQLINLFDDFLPLVLSMMAVGIFTLTVSLLPSKSHLAGNRYADAVAGEPTHDELKNQGW